MTTVLVRFISLALLCVCACLAQGQTCHYGQGSDGLSADLRALRAEKTCRAVYALYQKCAWGSGADAARAEVVTDTCKANFDTKLTPPQRLTFNTKLQLCTDEYDGMDGTMWLSESASCTAQVYFEFGTDLAEASKPVPKASFDCSRAHTATEHTVCSDEKLGHYDLLLSYAFQAFLKQVKGSNRNTLVQDQRTWNAHTPQACAVATTGASPATLTCLRNRYRDRMQQLVNCADGAEVACLQRQASPV